MRTPLTFVASRIVIGCVTMSLLLLIGLGLAGIGPLRMFWMGTDIAMRWFQDMTGVPLR
jgi:hypothetical protein